MDIIALQCHEKDNVAVVFTENLEAGMEIRTQYGVTAEQPEGGAK